MKSITDAIEEAYHIGDTLVFIREHQIQNVDRSIAEELLEEKTQDPRISLWKGPLVKWILGLINEDELRKECAGNNEGDTVERHWLAEFYATLMRRSNNDGDLRFRKIMSHLTDTSKPEWKNESFFFNRIWKEEFFLARCEATK